jgi:tripartite-type tricarboxylate transporter receptor subunit TctC
MTVSESGYAGFKGEAWMGLVARAGTPRAIIQQLNLELARVLGLAEVRQFFDTAGSRVVTSSPEEFANLIRDDRARWGKIIKDAGIRLE